MFKPKDNIKDYTLEELARIKTEADIEAQFEATRVLHEDFGGEDKYCCGFAWLSIWDKIHGGSKLAKNLASLGIERGYEGSYDQWNPSGWTGQNIDVKEAGAKASAKVWEKYGFRASVRSRMD